MTAIYDRIGLDYARLRRPDPRVAARIEAALGTARTVLNVGAGAGSYEPPGREVIALEPSAEMIRQRPANAAPCVQGVVEDLPFGDGAFDAAMGVLTVHHWADKAAGMAEIRRVARDRIVLLTFDAAHPGCWVLDYFPQNRAVDAAQFPAMEDYARWLGPVRTRPVPIPHDCTDGFLYAYWRRPEAYLDPKVRAAISSFHVLDGVDMGIARLRADLESGAWMRRYGEVMALEEIDAGYRLVVAEGSSGASG